MGVSFLSLQFNRGHFGVLLLGALIFLGAQQVALAGTVALPLNPSFKRPASDLVYQGRRIDDAEAGDLIRRGQELWHLNPEESVLWKEGRLDLTNEAQHHFPTDGAVVHFDSYLASTKGIFRASVDGIDESVPRLVSGELDAAAIRPFTLSVSLSNPGAMMRAALLRRVGYQVDNPKYYRTLKVTFKDISSRDQFLNLMADRSLSSRKRWIKDAPTDRPEVTLQGVVLEPGRINVQTAHWGLMSPAQQRDRRVFRALILPNVLLDFQEKVNGFGWETGRVFNDSILFDYLFWDSFPDVAYDDAKWFVSRMGALTREDFHAVVAQAQFPADIEAILTEKIISRRNAMLRLFGLASEFPMIPVQSDLTIGNVVQGQLTRDDYTGSPLEFFKKPELPPLRLSQLWRFVAVEGISAGISQLIGQVNEALLKSSTSATALTAHQDEVSKGIASYLFKTGSLNGYQQSAGVWAKPTAGAHINASRNVIAGTYMGSDSQVQLVDTLSVDAGLGFYLGYDGAAPIVPGVSGSVTLSRSYSHIKPVQDMNTALKTNWGNLVVSGFMKKLAGSLNPDIQCGIAEGPWTSEFIVDAVTFTKINYDMKRPNGKEEALALRTKLVAGGMIADRIILQANHRDEDCKAEVEKALSANLEGFMEDLAVGDTFVITDSIKLGAAGSVNIPIAVLAGAQLSATVTGGVDYEIARQTMIRRVSNGFQVYLQDRHLDTASYGLDLNFFINIVGFSRGAYHGKAETEFYNIVSEGADAATKLKLMRSIKVLLDSNSAEVLSDSFNPYTLKHDLDGRVAKFRFLFWSLESQGQDHEVDIYPPIDPQGEHNRGDYKRTLAMKRMVTRTGQDVFGFLLGVAGRFTGGVVGPQSFGLGGDPGNSPLGTSFQGAISTQGEVTEGVVLKPVTVMEQTYRGWLMPKSGLMKIFDRIEGVYGSVTASKTPDSRTLFDRSLFNDTSSMQLYQIDTTLLFYPETLELLSKRVLLDYDERGLFNHLLSLYGKRRTQLFCDAAEMQFGRHGQQIYYGRGFQACAPDWIHGVMRLRREGLPQDKRAQLGWYNSLMSYFVNNANMTQFLRTLDSKHYFFVTRVNGFRKNDANGAIDYLSDTVGKYDSERGLGIYRDISTSHGIALFELYARFFTGGL